MANSGHACTPVPDVVASCDRQRATYRKAGIGGTTCWERFLSIFGRGSQTADAKARHGREIFEHQLIVMVQRM